MNTTTSSTRSSSGQALYEGLENLPSSKRFTSQQLEAIYALGYSHLAQAQYAQALPIFAFLSQYGPTSRHYLYGFALSLQMLGRLDEAISMYSLCSMLFPESLEAIQRIAQCQVSDGRREDACETLTNLAEYARLCGNTDIKNKAHGMLNLISARDSA